MKRPRFWLFALPGDRPAQRVWLSEGRIYAMAGDGTIYVRTTFLNPHDGVTSGKASRQRYGDSEQNYSRPHLAPLFDPYPEEEALPGL